MTKTSFLLPAITSMMSSITNAMDIAHMFAELDQLENKTHTCNTAMNVLKEQDITDDRFNELNSGTVEWTDDKWPHLDSLYWLDQNEHEEDMAEIASVLHDLTWERVKDLETEGFTLWGPDGKSSVDPGDINQGSIGNCWLLSAMSALAEVPGRIDDMIVNEDIS